MFDRLLRQLQRDFRQVSRIENDIGGAIETHTEDNEYTRYKIEYWLEEPVTITTPDGTQYYHYGGCQRNEKTH